MDVPVKQSYKRLLQIVSVMAAALVVIGLVAGIGYFLILKKPTTPKGEQVGKRPTAGTSKVPLNPYDPEDFVYKDRYMSCLGTEYMLGVDVSTYQRNIDWKKVAESGIEFVIIRAGYRGYGQAGTLNEDEWAQRHYKGARAAGLKVGAYFFSQAINPEEAREEARYLMQLTKDWVLEMPLIFDWEYISWVDTARTTGMTADEVIACTRAFCEEVEEAGKWPMIYFNANQAKSSKYLEELVQYDKWLAMYSDVMDFPYAVNMWQYTSTGKVPGISSRADINIWLFD